MLLMVGFAGSSLDGLVLDFESPKFSHHIPQALDRLLSTTPISSRSALVLHILVTPNFPKQCRFLVRVCREASPAFYVAPLLTDAPFPAPSLAPSPTLGELLYSISHRSCGRGVPGH